MNCDYQDMILFFRHPDSREMSKTEEWGSLPRSPRRLFPPEQQAWGWEAAAPAMLPGEN